MLSALIALASGYWLAWWAGVVIMLVLGWLSYLEAQRVPGTLRQVREGEWQILAGQGWRRVSLEIVRLGPWLIGLDIAGKRYWIWPDSASSTALRHLRRALLRASSVLDESSAGA